MRFWELQEDARSETLRLLVVFALAVAATVLGVHAALTLCFRAVQFVSPWPMELPRLFSTVNVGVTLMLVLGGCWIETSNLKMPGGAERLARRLGAREVRPASDAAEQRLANIVDEVCIAANMPRPQVMVLPRHDAINAFATGWSAEDAVVAVHEVGRSWLRRLDPAAVAAAAFNAVGAGLGIRLFDLLKPLVDHRERFPLRDNCD